MKKRYIYLLLFLLMIPCFIKADYLNSLNEAGKYKNRIISSAISNYFYNDDYALEGNTVKKVNDNFLSIDEFNITSISNGVYKNGYSYIYDGSKVWTLTVNDENSHFVMSNFKNDTSNNSSNNVYTKPTIMINTSKVAGGSGRFEDPWVFIEEYDVIFTSEDEDIIKINPKKIKVLSGESGTVEYEVLKNGYSIKGTSCKDATSIDNTNKKITVKNVTRNMECIVYIDAGLYEITLEGYDSPKVLYLKFDKGYYTDKQTTKIASKIEVPTKTGHTFGGYRYGDTLFIDASGKIVGAKNLITGDVTLSPIMNAIKTTYNYTCSSDVTTCTYDIDCRIASSICGKKGYTHTGWVDQNGKTYVTEENVKNYVSTNGVTLTLTPTYTANSYTLYYDGNGGSVSSTNKSVTFDSAYGTLPTPTRTGYTFSGWYTSKDGGTKVTESSIYTIDNSSTIYAHWSANNYTIVYNANNGSGSMSNTSCTYGNSYSLRSNTFTRTGYSFLGWSTSSSATSATYTNGQSVSNLTATNNGTVNLYAVWQANTYTIVYNANGGSGSMSNTSCSYGKSYALRNNTFTRTGYSFLGWSTSSSATSATYTNGQSVSNLTTTNGGTINLYAVWQANTYTITYNTNGGSGSMSNTSCTYGNSYALRNNTFTRTGYSFLGWSTSSGATSATYSNGQTVSNLTTTNNGTVNLYAVWKANTYTIVYNTNGGSGSMSNTSCTYGSNCTLRSNSFSRSNYSFLGWSTSSSATSATYSNGQTVSNLTTTNGGTINLYAVWKANYRCTSGTLTADSNKGASSGGYVCVVSGQYWEDSYSCNCDTCSRCASESCSTVSTGRCRYDWMCGEWGSGVGYSGCGGCTGSSCCCHYYTCSQYLTEQVCSCSRYTYYSCYCDTCWDWGYSCPSGYKTYSGSGSSLKCYKAATAG